jgi:hypothetical protein
MKFSEVLSMRQCRWVIGRLSGYLDRDPSAQWSEKDMTRLENHIAICERCASLSQDYRETSAALSQYRQSLDSASIKRLSESLLKLTSADEQSN